MTTNLDYVGDSVTAGASMAYQKSSELAGQAAVTAKAGASTVVEAGKDAATFVKTKMDETGVTSGAQAAGTAVYATGAAGATVVK